MENTIDVSWICQLIKILLHMDSRSMRAGYSSMSESPDVMKCKFNKCWEKVPSSLALASIMDPRYKIHALQLSKLPESNGSQEMSKHYEISLTKMYKKYCKKMPGLSEGTSKSDLQKYLNQPIYNVMEGEEFNVLVWWKAEEGTYPILSIMARDLLTKPVNGVAPELDFDPCGSFATENRYLLKLNMVEKLIYMRDWFVDGNGLLVEDAYDITELVQVLDL